MIIVLNTNAQKNAIGHIDIKAEKKAISLNTKVRTMVLEIGESSNIGAYTTPLISIGSTIYESSNTSIANVDGDGNVSAVSEGNITIYVRHGNFEASVSVICVKSLNYTWKKGYNTGSQYKTDKNYITTEEILTDSEFPENHLLLIEGYDISITGSVDGINYSLLSFMEDARWIAKGNQSKLPTQTRWKIVLRKHDESEIDNPQELGNLLQMIPFDSITIENAVWNNGIRGGYGWTTIYGTSSDNGKSCMTIASFGTNTVPSGTVIRVANGYRFGLSTVLSDSTFKTINYNTAKTNPVTVDYADYDYFDICIFKDDHSAITTEEAKAALIVEYPNSQK